jgi:hypothetical protein
MKRRKTARKDKAQQDPVPKKAPEPVDHQELMAGEELEASDEGLREAESELGISDWIDPDTGGPAEDSVPHIEDH